MRINNNVMALNTHRQYTIANSGLAGSSEKLSSGYKINRAGDDAAGLAISEKMRAQIRGLDMASKNSQDAISLVQTAEGALQETHNILQRMRELAVQSGSDTNNAEVDREALDAEFQQLMREIDDTAEKTKFNNMGVIDGTFDKTNGTVADNAAGKDFVVQTGANQGDTLTINIDRMDAKVLGLKGTDTYDYDGEAYDPADAGTAPGAVSGGGRVHILTGAAARGENETATGGNDYTGSGAIKLVDDAINTVSTQRAKLGALQNRLNHKINNLDTSSENLTAAESRIRDIDMAKEMSNYTKQNILIQASTAMLAQANSAPQNVLSLLR